MLSDNAVTDEQVGVSIGHCTFLGVVNRDCLIRFHSVPNFIRVHGRSRAKRWSSVKAEILCFLGLKPLTQADLTLAW